MRFFCLVKKRTAAVLIAVFAAAVLAAVAVSRALPAKDGATCAERAKYISRLGIYADKNAENRRAVQIPLVFGAVYENYNKLQRRAGYDLTAYKGTDAAVYSYPVKNAPGYSVNLIVYRGRIIGGDVSSASLNGEMLPLIKEEIKKCLK